MSRYVCVLRAKQLWLTTPLAMKSPVPVVMSKSSSSMPIGSIEATRSGASLFSAMPSIERFLVIAGSVVWKNRSTSLSPPSSRTHFMPLDRFRSSITTSNSRDFIDETVQPMISGSVLETRQTPWL
jgi:hypothetical protein